MTDEEGALLALVLHECYSNNGYTVVSSEAVLRGGDSEASKKYIQEHLPRAGGLVDRLFDRNKRTTRLSIKSFQKDGYVVDYDGRFGKYFEKNGGGWRKWYEENPNAHGFTTVSLPVYDDESGFVLVYKGTQLDWLAGSGWVILYRYETKELPGCRAIRLREQAVRC
jgi:hypothetical protein